MVSVYVLTRSLHDFFPPEITSEDPPGRATLLYKPYRYVPPQRVGFLRRFGLKTGINFAHFGLESCMVFEGTTGVHEGIDRSNSK